MQSKAKTVAQYLAELPADRRQTVEQVRQLILANLAPGYEEGMQYGMIGYFLPHSVYPPGYHCDPKQPLSFACLASQKNHLSLYLMCIYCNADDRAAFDKTVAKSGKKLDMGKSCIRFKTVDDLPLELIAQTIRRMTAKRYIAGYEAALAGVKRTKASQAKTPSKRPAKKKAKARARA